MYRLTFIIPINGVGVSESFSGKTLLQTTASWTDGLLDWASFHFPFFQVCLGFFFSSFSSSCSLSFQENELEVSNLGTVEEALISRHSIGKEQEDMKMTLEPRALLPQKLSGVLGYLLQSLLPSRPVDHSQLGLQWVSPYLLLLFLWVFEFLRSSLLQQQQNYVVSPSCGRVSGYIFLSVHYLSQKLVDFMWNHIKYMIFSELAIFVTFFTSQWCIKSLVAFSSPVLISVPSLLPSSIIIIK